MAEKRMGDNPLRRPDPVETLLSTNTEVRSKDIPSKQSINSTQSIQSIPKEDKPPRRERVKRDASRAGLPEGWTRFSFIVREDYEEKVKALAYWYRQDIKEVMDEILRQYLSKKSVSYTLDEAMEAYNKRRS